MAKKRANKLASQIVGEEVEIMCQQLVFCQEYVKDMNGTQAAIRAGYEKHSAAGNASRLLTNEKICLTIKQLMDDRLQAARVDKDLVLSELVKIAKADVRKIFNENGGILHPSEWPDDIAGAVASIEVDEIWDGVGRDKFQSGETKKIKFWKKEKALELLGKNLSLFVDKVEVSGKLTLEDLVTLANKVK